MRGGIHLYVLVDGEPVAEPDYGKWGEWFERSEEECRVEETVLAGGTVRVSTTFLGVDQSRVSDRPHAPVLWETIVFGGPIDGDQRRYVSRASAEAGHAEAVARCRAALGIG